MTTSTEVPGRWPAALNGRPYLIDTKPDAFGVGRYKQQTIPLLRQQSDQSSTPGEHSINPEGFWRSVVDSCHRGAGQSFRDRTDSDPYRFRQSAGIDVWTKHRLSLLPSLTQERSSGNGIQGVFAAGSYLYHSDGSTLYFTNGTTRPYTWTNCAIANGESTSNIPSTNGYCTDGKNIYVVYTDGLHTTTVGNVNGSHYVDEPSGRTYNIVGFVKGRLMAAANQGIYNITAGGTAPSSLYDHPNSTFTWQAFAEAQSWIYAAGDDGYKSLIVRMTIKSDGSGLDTPQQASVELPPGERVYQLYGYGGFLVLGTTFGVRVCQPDSNGNLLIGALIPNYEPGNKNSGNSPAYSIIGNDRFIYYNDRYSNAFINGVYTGISRADLTEFVAALAPAYANDLQSTTISSADVHSMALYQNELVLCIPSNGLYMSVSSTPVAAGTIDFGFMEFDLPADPKVPIFVDTQYWLPYANTSHTTYMCLDGVGPENGDAFSQVATHSHGATATSTSLGSAPVSYTAAKRFEVREKLTSSGSQAYISRVTLKAEPSTAEASLMWQVPVLLHHTLEDRHGAQTTLGYGTADNPTGDPLTELSLLRALRDARTPVAYQEGSDNYTVIVEDVDFISDEPEYDQGKQFMNGTAVLTLKRAA